MLKSKILTSIICCVKDEQSCISRTCSLCLMRLFTILTGSLFICYIILLVRISNIFSRFESLSGINLRNVKPCVKVHLALIIWYKFRMWDNRKQHFKKNAMSKLLMEQLLCNHKYMETLDWNNHIILFSVLSLY